MKLLVVRHGECVANLRRVVAGSRDDSPLTEHGVEDAIALGNRLSGIHLDAIVATPLQRSQRTAEIIRGLTAPGLLIETDPDFIEINAGSATGLPLDQYHAKEKSGEIIPGGETSTEALARVKRGLERLSRRHGTVLLVTHSGTYRVMTCIFENRPAPEFAFMPGLRHDAIEQFVL